MTPAQILLLAATAKQLVDKIPGPVLEPLILVLEGLLTDDASKQRRSLALASARAHKAAVEALVAKTTKRRPGA